jgi:hypothetical protein
MRSLTAFDFQSTGWRVDDPAVLAQVNGILTTQDTVFYPGMLEYCEADNLLAISALINVGHLVSDPNNVIGYQDRAAQLRLWKHQYGF